MAEVLTTQLETIKISSLTEATVINDVDYTLVVQDGATKKAKANLLKGGGSTETHTHTNKTELDKIVIGDKAKWDAKASTGVATTSANGLMSSADKTKLDGLNNVDTSTFQPKNDVTLNTTAKTIVGAINENKSSLDTIETRINNIEAGETNLDTIDGILNHNQENLFDSNGCENFFYDYEGNQIEAINGSVMSNFIRCKAGNLISRNGIATNVVCYFKEDKTFIERVDSYGLSTIKVPSNDEIAWVRMAVQVETGRKIAYGKYIIDDKKVGDYYSIPKLKVEENNLTFAIGIIESPDGTKWKLKVDNNGVLSTENMDGIIDESELPVDFPRYVVSGESANTEDYLITPYGVNNDTYIFIMNYKGQVKWYRRISTLVYNFRKYKNKDNKWRYTYFQGTGEQTFASYANGKIVVLDDNFNVLEDNVKLLKYGSITEETYPNENHDYVFINDGHYILSAYYPQTVTNIPNLEGVETKVINCIIQEVKDGVVVWQFESANCTELYTSSHSSNNFADYNSSQNNYLDYAHLNSIQIDKYNGDLLVSYRHIGLIKIKRNTDEILWILGRNNVGITDATSDMCGYLQHDARYQEDHSITIFDNSGCATGNTRVCRYWINEDSKTMTSFSENITQQIKSSFMGSANVVDESKNIYTIAYGGANNETALEEYSFTTATQNFKLKFNSGAILYRAFKGYEDNTYLIDSSNIPITDIILDSNVEIKKGLTKTINITLKPGDTTDTEIVWSSSNNDIATVSDGVVTAMEVGNCTVIATSAVNASIKGICNISVTSIEETIPNGYYRLAFSPISLGVNSAATNNGYLAYDKFSLYDKLLDGSNLKAVTYPVADYNTANSCRYECTFGRYNGVNTIGFKIEESKLGEYSNISSYLNENEIFVDVKLQDDVNLYFINKDADIIVNTDFLGETGVVIFMYIDNNSFSGQLLSNVQYLFPIESTIERADRLLGKDIAVGFKTIDDNKYVQVGIKSSLLISNDVEGYREFISKNPIEIYSK